MNPFTGHPFFNECVFVVDTRDEGGAPTRTLLTADVFWNYPARGQPGVSLMSARDRLWRAGMNRLYGLFYRRFMVGEERRALLEECVDACGEIDAVVPCHGRCVGARAGGRLRAHLGL